MFDYIICNSVPQILTMMVELNDDADWMTADDVEDDDDNEW